MSGKLGLDPGTVREARELARRAGEPITEMARTHTTVSVERAVLRLAGLDGADPDGMPWVNRLADAVAGSLGLEHGVALPFWHALETSGLLAAPARRGRRRGHGNVPAPRGRRWHGGRATRPPARFPGLRHHRRPASAAVPHDRGHRRPAQAVDLPDRGDR